MGKKDKDSRANETLNEIYYNFWGEDYQNLAEKASKSPFLTDEEKPMMDRESNNGLFLEKLIEKVLKVDKDYSLWKAVDEETKQEFQCLLKDYLTRIEEKGGDVMSAASEWRHNTREIIGKITKDYRIFRLSPGIEENTDLMRWDARIEVLIADMEMFCARDYMDFMSWQKKRTARVSDGRPDEDVLRFEELIAEKYADKRDELIKLMHTQFDRFQMQNGERGGKGSAICKVIKAAERCGVLYIDGLPIAELYRITKKEFGDTVGVIQGFYKYFPQTRMYSPISDEEIKHEIDEIKSLLNRENVPHSGLS